MSTEKTKQWPDAQHSIREAYRVLKIGGKPCLISLVYPTFWLFCFFSNVWLLDNVRNKYYKGMKMSFWKTTHGKYRVHGEFIDLGDSVMRLINQVDNGQVIKRHVGAGSESTLRILGHHLDDVIFYILKVLFEKNSGEGKVILNRPKKLNGLNCEMVDQILKRVLVYENDPAVNLVILKGNGRAFCAGVDLVSSFNYLVSFGASFYTKQMTLDYILATYKKPLIALLNGIVMGGGAGLSMNATFRIVTNNTVFAMPETAIGLFPDVGASYFLSQLPAFFGEYVGLTGARLDATMLLECGLVTHFVHSKDLDQLEDALNAVASSDIAKIFKIIENFVYKAQVVNHDLQKLVDFVFNASIMELRWKNVGVVYEPIWNMETEVRRGNNPNEEHMLGPLVLVMGDIKEVIYNAFKETFYINRELMLINGAVLAYMCSQLAVIDWPFAGESSAEYSELYILCLG